MTVTHARLIAPQELASFEPIAVWPSLSADEVAAHAPDASLIVPDGDGVRARCSVWWQAVPPLGAERLGVIGHYGAATVDDGRAILDAAANELARRGCTIAVGPMDGNTWRRYRLVVDRGTEPPFFLEPGNPDDWPSHYEAAGFTPSAHYFSALNTNLGVQDERMGEVAMRLKNVGVTLRTIDLSRFEQELARIYEVAEISFSNAFLYTPLPESAFSAQYQRIRQYVQPELVLLAEHEDRLVGFAFNIPDVLELGRGAPPRTAIIKTLAVLPGPTYTGLGSLLTDRSHATAAALGYQRVIHALMHESNRSLRISAHTGQPMRRYALFQRSLVSA
jgi:GNAT superfamily N-acetyltransferase